MTDQILLLRQRPDHVAHVGGTVMIDGDPFVIRAIKPKREAGVFLDYGGIVESNEVEATVERFDGYDGRETYTLEGTRSSLPGFDGTSGLDRAAVVRR